jgi:XTP/dITP diphosphohydrolase
MKTLLVATSNPGKLNEFRFFLKELPVTIVSLSDVGIPADAPEDAETFKENAILKATYYCKKSGLPVVADDGGFEIDALNGEPGVHSHRWISGDKDDEDEELIAHTLHKLQGVPKEKRGAQLHLVLAFATPDGYIETSDGIIRGIIHEKASDIRTKGFPYRSLLFIPEINKFYDHKLMTKEETDRYNHRKKALDLLKPIIISLLTKS